MLGHAEVQNLYLALRSQHDIFRLDVAVHDTVSVRRHQGLRALHRNPEKLFQAHRLLDALTQVLSFNKLHDQKNLALFLDHVMNSRDMRIVETGRAFGLFLEAATIEGIRAQNRREPLEGDGALQASVLPGTLPPCRLCLATRQSQSGLWCSRSETGTSGCPRLATRLLSLGGP